MKGKISPGVAAAIIVVVVGLFGFLGYRMLGGKSKMGGDKPANYEQMKAEEMAKMGAGMGTMRGGMMRSQMGAGRSTQGSNGPQ